MIMTKRHLIFIDGPFIFSRGVIRNNFKTFSIDYGQIIEIEPIERGNRDASFD